MGKKCKQGICMLISVLIMSAVVSYPIRAEEEISEQDIIDEILTAADDEYDTDQTDENWLSVSMEVLKYYAESAAGLEPLITERNWRFYDVIPDKVIDLSDALYFLNLYATLAADIEFDGYIPKRDGEYSPIVITTTELTETAIPLTTTMLTDTSEPSTESNTTTITSTTIKTTSTAESTKTTASGISTTVTTNTSISSTTKRTGSSLTNTGTTNTTLKTSKTTTSTTSSTSTVSGTTTEPLTTTTTTYISTRTPRAYGIDVSVYQGKVDWQAVKESGVEFAIIRAGYGKHVNQEDRYFDTNMKNAKEVGIDCGAYWFSYATTPEDAVKEADAFYEVIKGYKFEYPIFFDYETNDQYALKPAESSAIIHAFCERMESYGYYVSLCSYVSFLNYKIESEIFDCYDTWIAHYDVDVPWYSYDYGIWQYSCTGKVPGVDTDVDLNYSYRDYPDIMKDNHLNGF